jgi:hypothetical protein
MKANSNNKKLFIKYFFKIALNRKLNKRKRSRISKINVEIKQNRCKRK